MPRLLCALMTFCLALLMASAPVHAQAQDAPLHIAAALAAESRAPAPGQTSLIALEFAAAPGWHGYWRNPGDAGAAPRLSWQLPKGVTIGAPRFPAPQKLVVAGLMNHVFTGAHGLLMPLTIARDVPVGTRLTLRLRADWLACTDQICVPEGDDLALELSVGEGGVNAAQRARFDRWRQALPRPLGSVARFAVAGDGFQLAIPYPRDLPAANGWFYAQTENAVAYAAAQRMTRAGDEIRITLRKADLGYVAPKALDGVLRLDDGRAFAVHAEPGAVASDRAQGWTILLALAGALLGGVLLNIMPCVFPIISLKALSLARAGESASVARAEALAYAAGVILVCVALGGALLALRAGGAQIGWAFQLQDPRVILFLLLLAAALTLNLAGGFALEGFGGGAALAGQGGVSGAFWTGALAAFVATPCTGPFMAAALGAALVLPAAAALAIFAGLGLGLALPFVLLGFVPALRRRMPRPGAWMETFQRWLALPMALTAAALVWLLWRQTGATGVMLGVGGTLLIGIGLWLIGRRRQVSLVLLLGLLAIGAAALSPMLPRAGAGPVAARGAIAFSPARLAAYRAKGQPVFLYFTADWCISCKVNERVAIDRIETVAHFRKRGIVMMIGDWTNGDPEIARFLEAQGRSGVPLYLFYPAGGGAPRQLPQLLTPAMLSAL